MTVFAQRTISYRLARTATLLLIAATPLSALAHDPQSDPKATDEMRVGAASLAQSAFWSAQFSGTPCETHHSAFQ